MTSAADLFALQEVDLLRDARRSIIADVELRLGENEAVNAAREAVTDAEADVERVRREQKDLENDLADLDAKMQPLETRLYDGSVRNAKELSDMQKEFESMKARRGVMDDQGLAVIERLEEAQNVLRSAQDTLRNAEAYWKAEQQQLLAD